MSSKKAIQTDKAPKALGPYSQACQVGDSLYISGQLGLSPAGGKPAEGGTADQAHQALENLRAILYAAGYEMNDVVQVQIFLTDMGDFETINDVYTTFFTEPYPARAVVQVAALPARAQVEIMAVARRQPDR